MSETEADPAGDALRSPDGPVWALNGNCSVTVGSAKHPICRPPLISIVLLLRIEAWIWVELTFSWRDLGPSSVGRGVMKQGSRFSMNPKPRNNFIASLGEWPSLDLAERRATDTESPFVIVRSALYSAAHRGYAYFVFQC